MSIAKRENDMVKAVWNDATIAESNDTVLVKEVLDQAAICTFRRR